MGDIYEVDQVGKLQDISNEVFNIRADETPFSSMIRKDKKPVNMLASWQTESYRAPTLSGVMDGTDVSSYNGEARALLEMYGQILREPWKVSTLADLNGIAGVPEGETAHQKMLATKVLKFAIEGRCLSALECAAEASPSTPYATRGALLYLDSSAQSVKPVPAAFRPSSSNSYTGAIASFTEASFKAMLTAMMKEKKAKVNLTGIIGIEAQNVMDDWTARDPQGVAATLPCVRSFTAPLADKQLINVVTSFTFSAGTVQTHTSTFLALDAAGAPTSYTYKSGIFIDPRMWSLAFMQRPAMFDQPDLGGGPRGYAQTVMMLKCLNPLGQGRIYTAS